MQKEQKKKICTLAPAISTSYLLYISSVDNTVQTLEFVVRKFGQYGKYKIYFYLLKLKVWTPLSL